MTRPRTPDDSTPRKRRPLNETIVPPEIVVIKPTQVKRGLRHSPFIFGNDCSRDFCFRNTLPPAHSTQRCRSESLRYEEGRGLENIKMSILSEWDMKFEGPRFALDAVFERIGLIGRLLAQPSTK